MNGEYKKVIMITGGAGFIGSHVVKHFVDKYPDYLIVNYDSLTYAGNLDNLEGMDAYNNYVFIKGDITNGIEIGSAFEKFGITDIIHLAAESHVDNSIRNPYVFERTNVFGTLYLLNAAKFYWGEDGYENHRFHHVSTDEVYGALDMNPENKFTENTPYNPHSPYSASKASSDHFVKAFHDTYGLNVTISNCSNNYGPNQFPEKLIPLVISRLEERKEIPIYGKGLNVRDWLYVEDHANAIDTIFHEGKNGETYNVGGNHEMANIDIVNVIIEKYAEIRCEDENELKKLITYVTDRAGHDLRYAIDSTKLQAELGWKPLETFDTGIEKTVRWYILNKKWIDRIKDGRYKSIEYGQI